MLKTIILAASLAVFSAPVLTRTVQAAEKKKDSTKISVMGKVSTVKKDTDDYTSIKLTMADGKVYNITIDDKGKELAKQYEGISVVANGTTTTKDKDLWLTVETIGEKKKKGKK